MSLIFLHVRNVVCNINTNLCFNTFAIVNDVGIIKVNFEKHLRSLTSMFNVYQTGAE